MEAPESKNSVRQQAGQKGAAVKKAKLAAQQTDVPQRLEEYNTIVHPDGTTGPLDAWDRELAGMQQAQAGMGLTQEKLDAARVPDDGPTINLLQVAELIEKQQKPLVEGLNAIAKVVSKMQQDQAAPTPPADLGQTVEQGLPPTSPPDPTPPPQPAAEPIGHDWGIRGQPLDTILVPFWKPTVRDWCYALARGLSAQHNRQVEPGEAIYLVLARAWQQDPLRSIYENPATQSGPMHHFNPVIGGWA